LNYRTLPLLLFCNLVSSGRADVLNLEGEYFKPSGPIVWEAASVLPKTIMVYKVVPQHFSQRTLSNALAVASFKSINRIKSDTNTLEFRDNREHPTRFLRINPSVGWIWYMDERAIVYGKEPEDVPTGD